MWGRTSGFSTVTAGMALATSLRAQLFPPPSATGSLVEAPQGQAAVPLRLVDGELEVREPRDQRAERDPALEPSQGRTEAMVDPAAERQVLGGARAGQIERLGVIAPVSGVTVGGAEHDEEEGAGPDRAPLDLDVGGGHAPRELHGRVVAQQLVDHVRPDRRIVLPTLELGAVAQAARACRCR